MQACHKLEHFSAQLLSPEVVSARKKVRTSPGLVNTGLTTHLHNSGPTKHRVNYSLSGPWRLECGKHRVNCSLSYFQGPGLDPSVGTGGVSHHGGKWPGRLASLCGEITGEFEDEEMELYREA